MIIKILRNEDFNITTYLSIVNEFLNLFESNDYIMNEKLNNIYVIIIKYKSIIESNENNDIIINNINTFLGNIMIYFYLANKLKKIILIENKIH